MIVLQLLPGQIVAPFFVSGKVALGEEFLLIGAIAALDEAIA